MVSNGLGLFNNNIEASAGLEILKVSSIGLEIGDQQVDSSPEGQTVTGGRIGLLDANPFEGEDYVLGWRGDPDHSVVTWNKQYDFAADEPWTFEASVVSYDSETPAALMGNASSGGDTYAFWWMLRYSTSPDEMRLPDASIDGYIAYDFPAQQTWFRIAAIKGTDGIVRVHLNKNATPIDSYANAKAFSFGDPANSEFQLGASANYNFGGYCNTIAITKGYAKTMDELY